MEMPSIWEDERLERTEGEQAAAKLYSEEEYQPGGKCWPPHPLVEEDPDNLLTIDVGAEATLELISGMVADRLALLEVLLGKKSKEELLAEWELEEVYDVPAAAAATAEQGAEPSREDAHLVGAV